MKQFAVLLFIGKRWAILLVAAWSLLIGCRYPFYYSFERPEGVIYESDGDPIHVSFRSRRKLKIEGCEEGDLERFLRSLVLARHGRRELEHLLKSSASIELEVSDKVGVAQKEGKYYLIGGLTGPAKDDPRELIVNEASRDLWVRLFDKDRPLKVYEQNRIVLFKGSFRYLRDSTNELEAEEVCLHDLDRDRKVREFSMDSIELEPLRHPDMLYRSLREFYYFGGVHEIHHTRPENIDVQLRDGNRERGAIEKEKEAFEYRERLERRTIRKP